MILGKEQVRVQTSPYQLFIGLKLEEARDELRQGLYRPPPVHCPLLCFHYRSVSYSLQQHVYYKMEKIESETAAAAAIQAVPGKSKHETVWGNFWRNVESTDAYMRNHSGTTKSMTMCSELPHC